MSEISSDLCLSTRAEETGFWESYEYINVGRDEMITTPWKKLSSASAIPHDIAVDVKYADGWDLIVPRNEEEMKKHFLADLPHFVFHNRYTGILKVFSYLSKYSITANNHGIWEIEIDTPTSMFAFQENYIPKVSEKQKNKYYVSNITNNSTKGFTVGWNCFQIELAYDPSQSGHMTITHHAANIANLTFTGNLEASTSGIMATSKGNNNYGSGIAKIAGNEAGDWIKKKLNDKTILGIPSSIITEGVKAIVSGGVGYAIKAFTGLFKSDNSSNSIQLTTNGTFKIDGNVTFEGTIGIPAIKICLNPDSIGYLGVWGLKEEPTLLFSPYAVRRSVQEYTNGYTREYEVSILNHSITNTSIVINPSLNKFVKNYVSSVQFFQSSSVTRSNVLSNIGGYGRDPRYQNLVYEDLYKPYFYMIVDVAFKGEENAYLPVGSFEEPMEVFIPNVPGGPEGAVPDLRYNSHYVASIGVKLTLPNGSEAYSYHQCIPKLDWKLSEYDNGLYWYFYPCEPVQVLNRYFSTGHQNVGEEKQPKKLEL